MTRFRPGVPSQSELHLAHHRKVCGEPLSAIADSLGRRPQVLARYLDSYKPEVHPQEPNSGLKITLPGGAKIEGLTLNELVRLARVL